MDITTKGMKYVVTTRGAVAIFNDGTVHKDVARCLEGKPVGAGFIRIDYAGNLHGMRIQAVCYGESISLGIKSRGPEDEAIINKYLSQ